MFRQSRLHSNHPSAPWAVFVLMLCLFMDLEPTDPSPADAGGWHARTASDLATLSRATCSLNQADYQRLLQDDHVDKGCAGSVLSPASPCWQRYGLLQTAYSLLPVNIDSLSLPFSTGPPLAIPA